MDRRQWQEIDWARTTLGLGERASLAEIKRAFRRRCKENHPDLLPPGQEPAIAMQDINRAYRILLDYCAGFRFPLRRGIGEEIDDEEWWMDRFGNDPLWGRSPGGA